MLPPRFLRRCHRCDAGKCGSYSTSAALNDRARAAQKLRVTRWARTQPITADQTVDGYSHAKRMRTPRPPCQVQITTCAGSARPPNQARSAAATALGFGVRWLEMQIAAGAPCVRIGRSVRLRRKDVEAFARLGHWAKSGTVLTRTQIFDASCELGHRYRSAPRR